MKQIIRYISIAAIGLSLTSCTFTRFFVYNFADIRDYKKFPKRIIEKDSIPFQFYTAEKGDYPKTISNNLGDTLTFDEFLADHETVAFLIIKNDTIQYEQYFNGYSESSIVPSFSMAKSITSILIGCAIDDGIIQSVSEPVTHYIPEMKENGFDKVTIEHLLQMTSGLEFNEGYYNPFGEVAAFYYGRDLREATIDLELKGEAGEEFEYLSGNTQILGLLLDRTLKDKSISEYLEEKIWQELGMEYDASWSIDKKKNGLEKTFCCINARARDFAKIGRLYLNKGQWEGKQIVPESWVERSTKIDTSNGSAWNYQYQWWLPTRNGDFMANGFLGQYIYVNPDQKLIIVRLGKNNGDISWPSIFVKIAQDYAYENHEEQS